MSAPRGQFGDVALPSVLRAPSPSLHASPNPRPHDTSVLLIYLPGATLLLGSRLHQCKDEPLLWCLSISPRPRRQPREAAVSRAGPGLEDGIQP